MRDAKGREIMTALKEIATKDDALTINDLRIIVALERIVARIEADPKLSRHLIFKGGFVMLKTTESNRFTRDIDALAQEIRQTEVEEKVSNALVADLDDGLWFGDIKTRELARDLPYPGIRFDVAFQIGDPPAEDRKQKKLSRVHLDIGFGDVVSDPKTEKMKSLLSFSEPISWSIYPLEQIIAEKLHVVIARGAANSRAKDIYDLTILFRDDRVKQSNLTKAIEETFKNRKTALPRPIHQDLDQLDLTFLKGSWNSVELSSDLDFDSVWSTFLEQVKSLAD